MVGSTAACPKNRYRSFVLQCSINPIIGKNSGNARKMLHCSKLRGVGLKPCGGKAVTRGNGHVGHAQIRRPLMTVLRSQSARSWCAFPRNYPTGYVRLTKPRGGPRIINWHEPCLGWFESPTLWERCRISNMQSRPSRYSFESRGTCRIQNRSSPEIPRCSNFWHFTGTQKITERYRIDFPLFGPHCILARRCELVLSLAMSKTLRFRVIPTTS